MAGFSQGLDSTVQPQPAAPGNGPPAMARAGEIMQRLNSLGRPPTSTIDFPRYDSDGKAIQQVMVKVLTVREENVARSRARISAAIALKQKTHEAIPEEIIQNETITHMLAVACRDPENPEKPFFPYGPDEADTFCTSDELGTLALEYSMLRQRSGPRMSELTEDEMEAWIQGAAEDATLLPFSATAHAKLVMLFEYCAKSLVSLRRSSTSLTPAGSSSSES